tara:strand:+ start:119 stop:373 length:255 start_codon:yes stop_codon:yes gene_type:complete
MNYKNFEYDISNLIQYNNMKVPFCYDQILYVFFDKYNPLNDVTLCEYIKKYYNINNNYKTINIINDLLKIKGKSPEYIKYLLES